MGKLSKKLKKAAMAGIALYGASKMMKGKGVSDTYAKAKKAMTTDRAYGKPGNISKSMGTHYNYNFLFISINYSFVLLPWGALL